MAHQLVNEFEDLNLLSNTQTNTQSNTENTKLFIPLICNNQNANAWFMMSILKLTLKLKVVYHVNLTMNPEHNYDLR